MTQIKQQMLGQQLQRSISPLYVLIGQESYLLHDSIFQIKQRVKKTMGECDEKTLSIQSQEDWDRLVEEANSYSLFASTVLITIYYDKKTIEAYGKKVLLHYLSAINPHCVLIFHAPNVSATSLHWLTNHEHAAIVLSYPLNAQAIKHWITNQLHEKKLRVEPQIPELIYQHTQGNMLACAQVIEKLDLCHTPNECINSESVLEQLFDQCNNTLYELVDACLQGKADKALHIIRQSASNKTEATLVLWVLTQEVRILLQLLFLIPKLDFKAACNQLKIWATRTTLYHAALKRIDTGLLRQLLHACTCIDERIKSNVPATTVWNSLEQLALSLCLGQFRG